MGLAFLLDGKNGTPFRQRWEVALEEIPKTLAISLRHGGEYATLLTQIMQRRA